MGGGPAPTYFKPVTTAPLCPWGFYPSGRVHHALDYPTPVGTKFRIARAGVVKVAGWSTTGFGNHIRVLLDDGNTVIYGHLSKFYVKVGQRVTAGQFGGETGNSGNSTGPHIHMEVRTVSLDPTTAWDFTSRLVNYPTPTVTPTPAPEDPFMSITVKNPGDGTQWKLEMALWSMWTYAIREWYSVTGKTMPTKWYDNVAPDGKVTNPLDGTAWEVPSVLWSIWWHNFNGATAAATPSPAPTLVPATQYGVDVSGNQSVAQVKEAVANSKYGYFFLKATEGQTFVNSLLDEQYAAIRASGRPMGFYHYAWQNHDPVTEAHHFLSTIGSRLQRGDVLACDIENWDSKNAYAAMQGVSWQQRYEYYMGFREVLVAETGNVGVIYPLWTVIKAFRERCGMQNPDGTIKSTPTPEWLDLTKSGLWLPQYKLNGVAVQPGQHDTVNGGWDVWMHQYTSTENLLDANYMADPAAWSKYAVLGN